MSGVVLRCPQCGTTRATPGECEACHEATVRYFCTNHQPGRWLDAASCTACGARFGVAAPPASPPRPRHPPAPMPPPRRDTASGPAPAARPAGPPAREEDVFDPLEEFLRATARAHHRPPAPVISPAPIVRGLAGCFVRAVLLLVFLVVAFVGMLVLFGGSFARMFIGY